MPAIPLPFIVTGLLALLLIRMIQQGNRETWFLLFVGACAVQSALVGLRWSVDPGWTRIVQPVLAACLPPLALAALESMRSSRVSPVHVLWPIAVTVAGRMVPSAVDTILIVEFVLYAVIILRTRSPADRLTRVRFGDEWAVSYARYAVAALLALSALADAIIALDLAGGSGTIAAPTVAAAMSVILLGLSGAFLARAGGTVPADAVEPAPPNPPIASAHSEEEQAILAAVEALLAEGLYRDYDLTLQRLSRRTRIPARKISQAVNRLRGCTVTDLVNTYRVREAMRMLREGSLPVTQIMLEAGFQTKSNFNRAFREIAGQTPSDYRRSESG